MSNPWSLERIRTQLRTESGLVGSDYYGDDGVLNDVINRALEEVWIFLTDDSVGQGKRKVVIATTPGVENVTLPADHNETRMLLRPLANTSEPRPAVRTTEPRWIEQFGFENTDLPELPGAYWYNETTLTLRPVPVIAESLILIYVKNAPRLQLDTDEVSLPNGAVGPLIDLAAGFILRNPAERQEKLAKGRAGLIDIVARFAQRRDRYPDWVANYRRGGQGRHGGLGFY